MGLNSIGECRPFARWSQLEGLRKGIMCACRHPPIVL